MMAANNVSSGNLASSTTNNIQNSSAPIQTIQQLTSGNPSNTNYNQHELLPNELLQQEEAFNWSTSASSLFTDQVSQTKLLASLILFIITLLCGYLPVRCLPNQHYIQYAMFAGGGVLMATAFCHLIPEAHDNYKLISSGALGTGSQHQHQHATAVAPSQNLSAPNGSLDLTTMIAHESHEAAAASAGGSLNVPYLEVTLCCGFFFMYLVEQLMVRFINNHTHEHPCDTSIGQLVVGAGDSCGGGAANGPALGHTESSATSGVSGNLSVSVSTSSGVGGGGGRTTGTEFYKFIRGLLIVSAFGAHSIFDGVAIGSQETVEKVWTIFLAITCHKLIIAAVVGLELYAATLESHLWTLVHLSIFSIMSPIGICLVVLAQNSLQLDANHPAMILLQSFATGTLLYIVFVEILQPKGNQAYEKNRFGKSVSLIAGFALMLMVLTLIDE